MDTSCKEESAQLDIYADCYPARVAELAYRPLSELGPEDLGVVTAALRGSPRHPGRPFLELLRDCLLASLGTEVAIGGADGTAQPTEDDIGLA